MNERAKAHATEFLSGLGDVLKIAEKNGGKPLECAESREAFWRLFSDGSTASDRQVSPASQ